VIAEIVIENYKSIERLVLPLGRINLFIGENGAGKSNILEAIALAGAAQADKLDNEFLASRGIRVSGPALMRSAFKSAKLSEAVKLSAEMPSGARFSYELTNDNKP
jgi:predicted ATPase